MVAKTTIGVSYIVSDDHAGLTGALKSVFPRVAWNRCHTHLARNTQDHVSKAAYKVPVAQDVRAILQESDLETALFLLNRFPDRWASLDPKLVHWTQFNIPQVSQVLALDHVYRRSLRTSNLIERFNHEIKRRSFDPIESFLQKICCVTFHKKKKFNILRPSQ